MLLLSSLIALLVAALSGMGVGGGGLLIVVLTLFTDTPQLLAQGINLLFFLFSSGASLLLHLRKRTIRYPAVALMAIAGILGAYLGSHTATLVQEDLLRRGFGCLLIIGGILSLQSKTAKKKKSKEKSPPPYK